MKITLIILGVFIIYIIWLRYEIKHALKEGDEWMEKLNDEEKEKIYMDSYKK
jgi:preprotein translocase subunit SecG